MEENSRRQLLSVPQLELLVLSICTQRVQTPQTHNNTIRVRTQFIQNNQSILNNIKVININIRHHFNHHQNFSSINTSSITHHFTLHTPSSNITIYMQMYFTPMTYYMSELCYWTYTHHFSSFSSFPKYDSIWMRERRLTIYYTLAHYQDSYHK